MLKLIPALDRSVRTYALRHLVAHCVQAQRWAQVELLLSLFDFLEAKAKTTDIYEVLRDFEDALAEMPPADAGTAVVQDVRKVIDASSHDLALDSSLLGQHVYNALVWHWPETTRFGWYLRMASRQPSRPWLKLLKEPAVSADPDLLRILRVQPEQAPAMAYSPDGSVIATGDLDGAVKLWDARTGAPRGTFMQHKGSVIAVTFSPDGKRLAIVTRDPATHYDYGVNIAPGVLRLFDIETGGLLRAFEGEEHYIERVNFSRDGRYIATSGSSRTVQIRHGGSGEPLLILREHKDCITSLTFSPDMVTVVTGSQDKTAKVWNLASGSVEFSIEHEASVDSVSADPNDAIVAIGSSDYSASLWNIQTGTFQGRFLRHKGALAYRSKKTTVSTSRYFGGARTLAEFSPNGSLIAIAGDNGILLYDRLKGALKQHLVDKSAIVEAIAWSPDSKTLISAGGDGSVRVWNASGISLQQSSPELRS